MVPRGIVQRLEHPESGYPRVQWLTRDTGALFGSAEWGWSGDKSEAYVFAAYAAATPTDVAKSASDHVEMLAAAGEKHVYPVVFGRDAEQARVEAKRPVVIKPVPRVGIDSAEVFEREERRHLA